MAEPIAIFNPSLLRMLGNLRSMSVVSGNVTLMVSSIANSVRFYSEILGLRVKSHYGEHFAEVATEGLTIGLHPKRPIDQPANSDSVSIGLSVASLSDSMKELKEKGIIFENAPIDDREVKIAHFNGPGGYPLYLAEVRKWS